MFAFGRLFIANPDLVERFRTRAPLNELQTDMLYEGDARGFMSTIRQAMVSVAS